MADKSLRHLIKRAKAANPPGADVLTAANVVLDHESRPAFDALLAEFLRALQPVGPVENALVQDLAAARWRLCRAWAMESASLDVEVASQGPRIVEEFEAADHATVSALAFRSLAGHTGDFTHLNRYEARHRRAFDRALRNLYLVQRARTGKKSKEPSARNEPR